MYVYICVCVCWLSITIHENHLMLGISFKNKLKGYACHTCRHMHHFTLPTSWLYLCVWHMNAQTKLTCVFQNHWSKPIGIYLEQYWLDSCNLQPGPIELLKMENSIYKSKLTPLRQRNPIKTVCSRQKRIRSYRTYKQKLASLTLEANIDKASIG